MTKVIKLEKVREYQTILKMCDATEKIVKRDKRLSMEDRHNKLKRVARTRATCASKLGQLIVGEEA